MKRQVLRTSFPAMYIHLLLQQPSGIVSVEPTALRMLYRIEERDYSPGSRPFVTSAPGFLFSTRFPVIASPPLAPAPIPRGRQRTSYPPTSRRHTGSSFSRHRFSMLVCFRASAGGGEQPSAERDRYPLLSILPTLLSRSLFLSATHYPESRLLIPYDMYLGPKF